MAIATIFHGWCRASAGTTAKVVAVQFRDLPRGGGRTHGSRQPTAATDTRGGTAAPTDAICEWPGLMDNHGISWYTTVIMVLILYKL